MNPEVIKSFLVSINYKVDGTSEKKFKDGVTSATRMVAGLAAAALAASTAVVAGVTRMSRSMDDLYWASQRTGSSVAAINSLTYAASQMGTTAEDARSSLEGLAQRIRTNPGYGSLVQSLTGGGTNLQNTAEVLQRLGERFRALQAQPGGQGYAIANQYAQMLGISEPMLQAMIRGLDRFGADYRRRLRLFGVDSDAAARSGQGVMRAWRETQSNFSIMSERIVHALGPRVEQGFRDFNRWLERNNKRVVRFIEVILNAILRLGEAFGELFTEENMARLEAALEGIISTMETLVRWMGQGSTAVNTLQVALGALLVYMAGTWAAGVLGVFASLSAGLTASTFGRLLARLGLGAALVLPSGGNNEAEDLRRFVPETYGPPAPISPNAAPLPSDPRALDRLGTRIEGAEERNADRILDGLRNLFGFSPANAAQPPAGGMPGASESGAGGVARQSRSDPEFAAEFGPAAERVAQRLGVSRETILAHWSLETHNGRAFAGRNNLGNLTATASQPGTAGGDRDANGNPITQRFMNFPSIEAFAEYYAGWVERRAPDARNQTNALTYGAALQRGGYATNPAFAAALNGVARRYQGGVFGGPALGAPPALRGPGQPLGAGGLPVAGGSLQQTTNITVAGAGDPAAVARAVGTEQRRVNADLERNLRGNVR